MKQTQGLDIDALKIVADGVNSSSDKKIIFSNYSLSKIVKFYKTRFCSCFSNGKIVKSGTKNWRCN